MGSAQVLEPLGRNNGLYRPATNAFVMVVTEFAAIPYCANVIGQPSMHDNMHPCSSLA